MAEDADLLREYESEAFERVQAMEESLLTLAREPASIPALNDLFRHVHTVKGNSGFVGFNGVVALCHSLEDTLGGIRKAGRPLTTEEITSFLGTVDSIRRELKASLEVAEKEAANGQLTDTADEQQSLGSSGIVAAFVDQCLVGFPIDSVSEICLLPRIATVLHAKEWLRGLANVRGDIIPVVSLGGVLGVCERKARRFLVVVESHAEKVGIEVDRLVGVRRVTRAGGDVGGAYWRGKIDEGPITILADIHRLCT